MNRIEAQLVTHEILYTLLESIEERAYLAKKYKHKAKYITCECGVRILVVPSIIEMSRSIEDHASKHQKRHTSARKAKTERARIENLLTQKLFTTVLTRT